MKNKINFNPNICECCGLTTNYIITVDKGSIDILKAIARAIGNKGMNIIHADKELLQDGYLTPIQRGNIAKPRSHGLIAAVKGEGMQGNYLLTTKGARFLRGEIRIPKYAIMNKVTKHQDGYHEPEKYNVGVNDFTDEYWEGVGYSIEQGKVIDDVYKQSTIA